MRRAAGPVRAFVNGLLCLAILGAAGFGAWRVAGRHWQVQETFRVRADFRSIGGVEEGGRVFVQGIDAGVVEAIVPPSAPGEPVALVLRVDARLRPLVRSDAVARIAAQGVVGSKVVEIRPGSAGAPPLPPDGAIGTEEAPELADLLTDARSSLQRVDAAATAAERGLAEITAVATSIREGEGTLGRLVRDDEAYRRLVRLTSEGERTLDDLNDNLDALKHTWPISGYFNKRAYFDRDRALYQPGADRESRTLEAAELFERGRAVLTAAGRRHLDEVAAWLEPRLKSESELVIASFTDESLDEDLAQVLTQERSEAVRRYLIDRHRVNAAGWFRSRKVAAIGFGTQAARSVPAPLGALPGSRVEIVMFTPRA